MPEHIDYDMFTRSLLNCPNKSLPTLPAGLFQSLQLYHSIFQNQVVQICNFQNFNCLKIPFIIETQTRKKTGLNIDDFECDWVSSERDIFVRVKGRRFFVRDGSGVLSGGFRDEKRIGVRQAGALLIDGSREFFCWPREAGSDAPSSSDSFRGRDVTSRMQNSAEGNEPDGPLWPARIHTYASRRVYVHYVPMCSAKKYSRG